MEDATKIRFLRFAVWVLSMLSASLFALIVDPRRTIFVPCIFLPLMVPMVLMPFKKSQSFR
jgi:ABC-type transport system involved in cytochrome c biogenesis permease component